MRATITLETDGKITKLPYNLNLEIPRDYLSKHQHALPYAPIGITERGRFDITALAAAAYVDDLFNAAIV
jgi:hypothetical protein